MGHGDLKGLWRSMYRDATNSCKKMQKGDWMKWHDMKWHPTFFNLQLWQLRCWTSPWSLTYHWLSSFPCPSLAKNRCYPRQPQNHKTTSKATRCLCSWGIMSKFIISFHQILGTKMVDYFQFKNSKHIHEDLPSFPRWATSMSLWSGILLIVYIYRWSISIGLFRLRIWESWKTSWWKAAVAGLLEANMNS